MVMMMVMMMMKWWNDEMMTTTMTTIIKLWFMIGNDGSLMIGSGSNSSNDEDYDSMMISNYDLTIMIMLQRCQSISCGQLVVNWDANFVFNSAESFNLRAMSLKGQFPHRPRRTLKHSVPWTWSESYSYLFGIIIQQRQQWDSNVKQCKYQ